MKNVIALIKSNPLVAASAIVSVLGIVVIGYFYFVAAPAHSAEKAELLKQQMQRQDALMRISVPLPNKDPNAPADLQQVVINPVVIREVGDIYSLIQTHYEDILVAAQDKNDEHHLGVLLGGNEIWPDADPTQRFDLYVQAASDYRDHFKAVFDVRSPNAWNMPVFSAASPPTRAELESALELAAFEFISSVGAQDASELTQGQAEQLFAEQRLTLMNALTSRAANIDLYVSLPPEEDRFARAAAAGSAGDAPAAPAAGFGFGSAPPAAAQNTAAQYPFAIAPWANADQPPTPDQLWEGQVQIWIMRDILIAISRMNNVNGTVQVVGPDGSIQNVRANVINSPIKRLLELKTLPGYVGLHNTGAAIGRSTSAPAFGGGGGREGALPFTGGNPTGVGARVSSGTSIYPDVPDDLVTLLAPKAISDRAVEHFGITPTGRVSNSVFDVRHTRLTIDIEAAKLPAFFEELRKANFMTVIKASITDLDEYELLKAGYVYGQADVVRAELVVESLWFRNWTEPLMPKVVKEKLLISEPNNAQRTAG